LPLFDVIKYDGSPDIFAWKYPREELTALSQLIVNESQEALLFKNGQALDLFPSGRHPFKQAHQSSLWRRISLCRRGLVHKQTKRSEYQMGNRYTDTNAGPEIQGVYSGSLPWAVRHCD